MWKRSGSRFMWLLASLGAGVLACASGCTGNECGDGTTSSDGTCVPTTESVECGPGTTFANGACVVALHACGAGTTLVDGACEAEGGSAGLSCGVGTGLDQASGTCVVVQDCGAGTEEVDGICVIVGAACAPGTSLGDEGQCIVTEPTACGLNTQRDAATGTCVPTDVVCGDGTAFDADAGHCVPTTDVCRPGTAFELSTRTCLPDACDVGDVLLVDVCVTPAEALAAVADLDETENNDPFVGGTAESFTPKPIGDTFAITGVIEAPADLNADSVLDQDVDVFTFDAAAGDWFNIAVQSTGLDRGGFVVTGPNGFVRASANTGGDAARRILAPATGAYEIRVSTFGADPAIWTSDRVGPLGGADQGYVLSVEAIAAPSATAVDLTSAAMDGDLLDLSDNLFESSNFAAGVFLDFAVEVTAPDANNPALPAAPALIILDAAGVPVSQHTGTQATVVVPASGTFQVLVDWVELQRPDAMFAVNETSGGYTATNLGTIAADSEATGNLAQLAANGSRSVSFELAPGQAFDIIQSNPAGTALNATLTDAAGVLDTGTLSATSGNPSDLQHIWAYSPTGGTFVLELENSTLNNLADIEVTVRSMTPRDLGSIGLGGTLSYARTTAAPSKTLDVYTLTLTEDLDLNVEVVAGSGDPDIELRDLSRSLLWSAGFIERGASGGSTESRTWTVPMGTYLFDVLAWNELADGYTISIDGLAAPAIVAPAATHTESGTAGAGDLIVALNGFDRPMDIAIIDSASTPIASAASHPVEAPLAAVYAAGGAFTVDFTNTGSSDAVGRPEVVVAPVVADFGSNGIGDSATQAASGLLAAGGFEAFVITLSERVSLDLSAIADTTGDLSVHILDATSSLRDLETPGDEGRVFAVDAGTYFIVVEAVTELTTGYALNLVLAAPAPGFIVDLQTGESDAQTFSGAPAGSIILVSATASAPMGPPGPSDAGVTIEDGSGNVLSSGLINLDPFFPGNDRAGAYYAAGGDYTVTVQQNGGPDPFQADVAVSIEPVTDLGAGAIGTPLNHVVAGPVSAGVVHYFLLTLAADARVDGTIGDGAGSDVDVALLRPDFSLIEEFIGPGEATVVRTLPAGTHLIEVTAAAIQTNGYTIDLQVIDPAVAAPGDLCGSAIDANASGAFSGSFGAYTDDYSPGGMSGCTGFAADGPDVTYFVDLTVGQTLDVSLISTTGGLNGNGVDTALYIVSDCSDAAGTCLDGDDQFPSPVTESVSHTAAADETVFIIVDAFTTGASGTYDMTVTIN